MKFLKLIPILFVSFSLNAQIIDLDSCLNLAVKNYPLLKKSDLLNQNTELKNKINLISNYPSVKINAQATWQNEVTGIQIDNPLFAGMFGEMSKDQYKVYAEFNQAIWDGGMVSAKREMNNSELLTAQQQIEVDLFLYKEQIVNLYFAVLSLQKQMEILEIKKRQLVNVIGDLNVAVENNVVMQYQVDLLIAEKMILEQNVLELNYESLSLLKMLSEYCGIEFDENASLLLPTPSEKLDMTITRPELQLFRLQSDQILAGKDLIKSSTMPKIYAFAQAGYGIPGLNMLSNDFAPFAIVGAKFVWSPWEWNKSKYEMKLLDVQSGIVANAEQTFLMHQNAKLKSQAEKIEKVKLLAEKDEDILQLRESITNAYLVQLNNGTIKSSDYLTALNDENSQRLKMELHELMMSEAIVKYNLIKGVGYKLE
jgi:outer membrane protein TolC